MPSKVSGLLVFFLLVYVGQATAHHSAAVHFRTDETHTISGVVTEFRFRNPHSTLFVEVESDEGEKEIWTIEWAPTGILRRMGVQPNLFKRGDEVTVIGNPSRNEGNFMLMVNLTFADGRGAFGGGAGSSD